MQPVEAACRWKEPSAQRLQRALPSPLAKLPALQLIGATDPATQKAPGGHAAQLRASMALVAFE